jgi:hypothetical protein
METVVVVAMVHPRSAFDLQNSSFVASIAAKARV